MSEFNSLEEINAELEAFKNNFKEFKAFHRDNFTFAANYKMELKTLYYFKMKGKKKRLWGIINRIIIRVGVGKSNRNKIVREGNGDYSLYIYWNVFNDFPEFDLEHVTQLQMDEFNAREFMKRI